MKLVLIESPYAGDIERNTHYARLCMKDCLQKNEAPYASHLLYTQPSVLDDTDPAERKLGIAAGLHWGSKADYVVVYTDLGITPGMVQGIKDHVKNNRKVIYRTLAGLS